MFGIKKGQTNCFLIRCKIGKGLQVKVRVHANDDEMFFYFPDKLMAETCVAAIESALKKRPNAILLEVNPYIREQKYWIKIKHSDMNELIETDFVVQIKLLGSKSYTYYQNDCPRSSSKSNKKDRCKFFAHRPKINPDESTHENHSGTCQAEHFYTSKKNQGSASPVPKQNQYQCQYQSSVSLYKASSGIQGKKIQAMDILRLGSGSQYRPASDDPSCPVL